MSDTAQEILFLCHRIPYPPNKGDKIRAYHWLEALARRYRVHLGTFVDDPDDWQHRAALDRLCDQQCYRPLHPRRARLKSLRGLLQREALSFAYYEDRVLQRWVDRLLAEREIKAILVFSSTMAPYVQDCAGVRRVLDFVDVDSDKWRQYAQRSTLPMRWVYAREADKLLAGERRLAMRFDASVFVSDAEATFFRQAAPESAARVSAIGNGVDSDYFDPSVSYDDPFAGDGASAVVFTGAMDYGANVDAVVWFVSHVWPQIRACHPRAVFWIVGTRPAATVRALAGRAGVEVTGAVPDVRPYLAHARAAVAPMRIARGIQNKVLEALAMGRPTIMSPQAAAGLKTPDRRAATVADGAEEFRRAVDKCLTAQPDPQAGGAARGFVIQHYGWPQQFERLFALLAPAGGSSSRSDEETAA